MTPQQGQNLQAMLRAAVQLGGLLDGVMAMLKTTRRQIYMIEGRLTRLERELKKSKEGEQ